VVLGTSAEIDEENWLPDKLPEGTTVPLPTAKGAVPY
jgi:hypothetical protein